MPRLPLNSIPTYRLHKQSGQAVVTLNGRDFLLGPHGTAASRGEYNRVIAEWIANDRQAPRAATDLTVSELIAQFKTFAEKEYATSAEARNYADALRPLRKLYGPTSAASFGPLKLEAVRAKMIGEFKWSRTYVNRQMGRCKFLFRWAVSRELVPPSVYQALATISGLRRGRSEAREPEPVKPVGDAMVEATIPHLPSTVAAMVQTQRLSGARPGELCGMKIGEIDRSGAVWTYRPAMHKTAHHGKQRVIHFGPKAQVVLRPFLLKLDPMAFVFSPADTVAEVQQRRSENRKTPLSCGNKPGSNVVRKPKRVAGEKYDTHTYARAIARACDIAFPVPEEIADDPAKAKAWRKDHRWHPHQLRHSAATDIRRQFGAEAAQHVLGHANMKMTEIYAEKNIELARAVAAKIG